MALKVMSVARVFVGIFFTLFVSFIIAGFPAIYQVLIDEGVYSSLCDGLTSCSEQELRLNLMFTIAISVSNSAGLVVGYVLQKTGPLITCCIGSTLVCAGSLLFAFSSSSFEAWMPAYILMGAGGPFIAFSMFSLTNLFPKYTGTIFSLIVASFDGSAVVMLIFNLLHQHLHLTLTQMFGIYAILPGALFFVSFWLFHKKKLDLEPSERSSLLDINSAKNSLDTAWFGSHPTFRGWFFSLPFILMTTWLSFYMTAKYFYMSNLGAQLKWITNDNQQQTDIAIQYYSIFLPGSAIFTPITSYLLDNNGAERSIWIMAFISALTGVFAVIPNYPLQFVAMAFLVFNRFFMFAAAPYFFKKMYGDYGMSTIYGVSLFIAACVNYSNYLWTYICINLLSYNFTVVLLVQSGLCLVSGITLGVFMFRWHRAYMKKQEVIISSE